MVDPAVQVFCSPNYSPTCRFYPGCMILPSLGSGGKLAVRMACSTFVTARPGNDRRGASRSRERVFTLRRLDVHRVRLVRRNAEGIHGLALHRGIDATVATQGIQCRADNRFGIDLEMATQ